MKICGQCEFENEDDVKSCTQCGAELDDISETEAEVSEAIEEAVNVSVTEDPAEALDDAAEDAGFEEAETEFVDNENPEEEIDGEEYDDDATAVMGSDDEQEFSPIPVEKKPVPKGVKIGLIAAIIVIAAAVLFYFFGSLSILAKVGIINSSRYIGIVQDKMIQETEDSPAVRLGDAFDAFFASEEVADEAEATEAEATEPGLMERLKNLIGISSDNSAVNWFTQKTADGVVVKAETVCTFDSQENTVTTYNVKMNFDGTIASEEFAASDKVLDSEQTLSAIQKIARYSDPAKTEYTTKELSSSKYNNREFYLPSGATVEMFMNTPYAAMLEGIPEDVEGSTDISIAQGLIPCDKYAQSMGMSFDELKEGMMTQYGIEITPEMTWGQVGDEVALRHYGITEETFPEIKEMYGFGDDVTLDTKFKDVKNIIVKVDLAESKRMQAEREAAAQEAEAEQETAAEPAETAETEQAAPAEEAPAEEAPAEEAPATETAE